MAQEQPARKRRRRPADERREQILDAASQLLVSQGPDATTMADVAAAAGVAKGTVYLYYASKADLLAGLRARFVDRWVDSYGDHLDGVSATAYVDGLLRFLGDVYQVHRESRELYHILFHEVGLGEDEPLARARQLVSEFVQYGVDAGFIAVAAVDVTADFLVSAVHGMLVGYVMAGRSRDEFVSALGEPVRRLLGLAAGGQSGG